MSTLNFARGNEMFPGLPYMELGAGVSTPYGSLLPPAGRVAAYVRSVAIQDLDPRPLRDQLVTTLAEGLKRARSGYGDTIVCLPGHSETLTAATALDELENGVHIMGIGWGSMMPTFRWTNTAAQWAIDNTDVVISGLRLRLEGANGVTKAINVTGADCAIIGCDIEVASGATAKAAIAIEVGTGAHRFKLLGNKLRGTATHNATNGVLVAAAVDQIEIAGNRMAFSITAANGCINFTAAATSALVMGNVLENTHTSSSAGLTVGNVAATGTVAYNVINILSTGAHTSNTTGINTGAGCLMRFFENYSSNDPRASGLLQPAVDT